MTTTQPTGMLALLAQGGRKRLAALEALSTVIRTDCGRQVGEMVGGGWDAKDAVEHYRDWLHDRVDADVDRFVAEDLQP